MISKQALEKYIKTIPPKPEIVQRVVNLLKDGELNKAGLLAETDPILKKFLQELVNKVFYGFKHKVTNISQIFSILGVNGANEAVYHYLLSLITPKQWKIFQLNNVTFQDFQANLGFYWRAVLKYENIKSREISLAISLLPASIILCDNLFYKSINELELIKDNSDFDFNIILKEITGISLFELILTMGEYWEFPKIALNIIQASSVKNKIKDTKILRLGQFMHLVLFYVLSKHEFVSSGLNNFIKFDIDYVMPVYKEFQGILEDKL